MNCPRCGAATPRLGICETCAGNCHVGLVHRVVTKCDWLTDWDAERTERYSDRYSGGVLIARPDDIWVK